MFRFCFPQVAQMFADFFNFLTEKVSIKIKIYENKMFDYR